MNAIYYHRMNEYKLASIFLAVINWIIALVPIVSALIKDVVDIGYGIVGSLWIIIQIFFFIKKHLQREKLLVKKYPPEKL